MIRDYNIAHDAGIQLHKILGATMAGQIPTGEIFWVGDGTDNSYTSMRPRVRGDRLYTDLDDVQSAVVANRGDIVVCLEGFNQTVSAAAGLVLDKAGVTIVFLGTGTSQAKITFDTDTGADMDVDAADITMIRPKFVAGIDALTGPIDVNATDFTIIDGEWHDAASIETTDCIIATSGATRLKIDGWKFFKSDEGGTQKESHIQLNGVDDAVLRNLHIEGDFDTGIIENVTDECLRITLEDMFLKNTDPGNAPCLVLDSACSGWARNVHLRNANGTVVSDNSDINWGADCLGFSTDGAAGDPIGTAAASGLEGKIDTVASDLIIADAIIDTVASDLVVLDTVADTIASDLIVLDAVADTIASDLIVLDAVADTIASDLIVLDAVADTIASDLIVLDAVADTIASDLVAFRTAWDAFETIMSDFVVKYESDNP